MSFPCFRNSEACDDKYHTLYLSDIDIVEESDTRVDHDPQILLTHPNCNRNVQFSEARVSAFGFLQSQWWSPVVSNVFDDCVITYITKSFPLRSLNWRLSSDCRVDDAPQILLTHSNVYRNFQISEAVVSEFGFLQNQWWSPVVSHGIDDCVIVYVTESFLVRSLNWKLSLTALHFIQNPTFRIPFMMLSNNLSNIMKSIL